MFWCPSFREQYMGVSSANSVTVLYCSFHTQKRKILNINQKELVPVLTLEQHRVSRLLFLIENFLWKLTAFFT